MAKIHILGAGALGSLMAVSLYRAGHAHQLITRQPEQAARIAANGIQCDDGHYPVSVVAATALAKETVQCLLLCTKAQDSLSALRGLGGALSPSAQIICVQNGIGQQQAIASCYPNASIYAALCTEGVTKHAEGHITHAGVGETTVGQLHGPTRALPQALFHHGLVFKQETHIAPALWRKLAINGAINGLTVQYDCLNGELINNPNVYNDVKALVAEMQQLLNAMGYNHVADTLPDDVYRVCKATALNTSSMLQDYRAGRSSEREYVYGTLLNEAYKYNIDVTLLRKLDDELNRRASL